MTCSSLIFRTVELKRILVIDTNLRVRSTSIYSAVYDWQYCILLVERPRRGKNLFSQRPSASPNASFYAPLQRPLPTLVRWILQHIVPRLESNVIRNHSIVVKKLSVWLVSISCRNSQRKKKTQMNKVDVWPSSWQSG